MASTGNTFPTVGAAVNRAGGTNAWATPGNVVSNNTTDTTVNTTTGTSHYLVTSGYGFAIPSNAIINGVTVRVEASETGTGNTTYIPQLHSATTPTLIGSAKGAVTVNGTTKVISSNGGISDTWGASLTPTIVNAAGFGVTLWSTDSGNNTLAVDFVTIAIDYSILGDHKVAMENPVVSLRSARQITTGVNLLQTTLAAPAGATNKPREPIFTPIPLRQVASQPLIFANLLLTTLAVTQQAPFNQADWPNPVVSAHVVQETTTVNLLANTLYTPPPTLISRDPLSIKRPPNPPPQQPDTTRSLLETTLEAQQAPFSQSDWPNPLRKKDSLEQHSLTLVSLYEGEKPFSFRDWPNPTLPKKIQQPEIQTGLLQTSMYVAPPTLLARDPLSIKRPPTPRAQQPEVISSLNTTLLTSPAVDQDPFRQVDWPNPVRRKDTFEQHSFEMVSLYSAGPFSQQDWPNPLPELVAQQPDLPQNLLGTLLYVAPQPLPFNQYDWPNPNPIKPAADRWNTSYVQNPEFMPPTVIPPEPPAATGGGGGGGGGGKIVYPARRGKHAAQLLDEALDRVVAEVMYRDLLTAPEAPAAARVVKPFAGTKRAAIPQPEAIDWAAVEQDAERLSQLVGLYEKLQARRRRIAEDDEWLMMGD